MILSHVSVTPSIIHLSLLLSGSDFLYLSSICFRKTFGVSYRKTNPNGEDCRNYLNKWPCKANIVLFGVGLFAYFSVFLENRNAASVPVLHIGE